MYRNRRIVSAAVLILVVLAGCSSAKTTPTPAVSTSTSAATTAPEATATAAQTSASTAAVTATTAACTKLNLNTLTENDLMSTIPNFSARMVREFQEYRPYVSIQQFRREIGKYVDTSQVTEWEQYVYVPIDPNNADAETLMQLPGVDETIASALIDGRSYDSNEAFLTALASYVDADPLAQASCYLAETT
ncbi:MAG: hypothetical protein U0521_15610 [Anaerolineae bacterium]